MNSRLFSENADKKKQRVIDILKDPIEGDMLLYDKLMSTALICMEYSEALSNKSVDDSLQKKMLELIEKAYLGFKPYIGTNLKNSALLQTIRNSIDMIKMQHLDYNLLKAYEAICIQLTTLRSHTASNTSIVESLAGGDQEKILQISLDNIDVAIENIKKEFFRNNPNLFTITNVIPFYSSNQTIGFNTILFCIFNDFSPVGLGENPHPIHGNTLKHSWASVLRHDYTHVYKIIKLKKDDPEIFEGYKKLYSELFKEKREGKINDEIFKKELLMLFYLVYDLNYSPLNSEGLDVRQHIINSTPELTPGDEYNYKAGPIINLSDYIKPLQKLGVDIPYVEDEPWKSAKALQNSMLSILDNFAIRHPEIEIKHREISQNRRV